MQRPEEQASNFKKLYDKENLHIQELGQSRLQQEPPYLVLDSTGS